MKSEKTYAVCNFLSYSFMFHKHFHTMLIITLSQSFKKVRIFMLILTHKPYIFITIAKTKLTKTLPATVFLNVSKMRKSVYNIFILLYTM